MNGLRVVVRQQVAEVAHAFIDAQAMQNDVYEFMMRALFHLRQIGCAAAEMASRAMPLEQLSTQSYLLCSSAERNRRFRSTDSVF